MTPHPLHGKTEFALWKNGLMLAATPEAFPRKLKELEKEYGPAWIRRSKLP